MYIGKTLGNGEDVTYSCIATDIDPYEFRDDFVGAQFRFRVGELLDEVILCGSELQLHYKLCVPKSKLSFC